MSTYVLLLCVMVAALAIARYAAPRSIKQSVKRTAAGLVAALAVFVALDLFNHGISFDAWQSRDVLLPFVLGAGFVIAVDCIVLSRRKRALS